MEEATIENHVNTQNNSLLTTDDLVMEIGKQHIEDMNSKKIIDSISIAYKKKQEDYLAVQANSLAANAKVAEVNTNANAKILDINNTTATKIASIEAQTNSRISNVETKANSQLIASENRKKDVEESLKLLTLHNNELDLVLTKTRKLLKEALEEIKKKDAILNKPKRAYNKKKK